MQVIRDAVPFIEKVIGVPRLVEGAEYRLLTYVVTCPVDEGLLLYNVLTRQMVLLSPEEAKGYVKRKDIDLISSRFLVPVGHDDRKLCQQIRGVNELLRKPLKAITNYTILPTTDCNARCFYCYEIGRPRVPMSEKVALDVAQYIQQHHGGENVRLTWFGGEPLYNSRAIDTICQELKRMSIDFWSSMVSNGYLFDDELIVHAKDDWHLKSVQITLDGTERTYNKHKAFIYRNVNAYQRVLSNIGKLVGKDIQVIVRLNFDSNTVAEIHDLIDELHRTFGENDNLRIYSSALFENQGGRPRTRSEEERRQLQKHHLELEKKIYELGYSKYRSLPTYIRRNMCMMDNENSIVITPKGNIGLCEHYSEDHFVGHINEDKFDTDAIKYLRERKPESPLCSTCVVFPDCFSLKHCGNVRNPKGCSPGIPERNVFRIRLAMMHEYETHRKKAEGSC